MSLEDKTADVRVGIPDWKSFKKTSTVSHVWSKGHIYRAIKAKCFDCSADQINEVRLCRITDCALWPYRMGLAGKKRLAAPVT